MLHSAFMGYFYFGMAAFLFLLGFWAWWTAGEAEDEGEMVEIHSLGQTTYREPWLQNLWAVLCFVFTAFMIVLGILSFL